MPSAGRVRHGRDVPKPHLVSYPTTIGMSGSRGSGVWPRGQLSPLVFTPCPLLKRAARPLGRYTPEMRVGAAYTSSGGSDFLCGSSGLDCLTHAALRARTGRQASLAVAIKRRNADGD